jgi:hypothetical protein
MPMLSELHFMLRTSHTMENRSPNPNGNRKKTNYEAHIYITYKSSYMVLITTLSHQGEILS